jgi:MarR family 2-MHQ and catechol resistance regulon transcriptional repressor
LGAKLLSSKANVSELLQNMERAGWIQRTPSAEDQRSHLLHLTPKGLEAVREAFPDFSRRLADLFEGISPEDRENLRRICRALGTGLEARSPKERPTNARAAKGWASTKE